LQKQTLVGAPSGFINLPAALAPLDGGAILPEGQAQSRVVAAPD
jgi:hypothetical protein